MSDALLADIVAHPNDDDPRLVWADREGGERGELVIIQCALAKGGQSREERKKLYARERELLAKHWPEAKGLLDPRFERGFIVHAATKLDDLASLLERHPLLTSIQLTDAGANIPGRGSVPPWPDYAPRLARALEPLAPGRLARIAASPVVRANYNYFYENRANAFVEVLAKTNVGRALRGLDLGDAVLSEPALWLFDAWTALEEVRLAVDFAFSRFVAFAAKHPRLTKLTLARFRPDANPVPILQSLTDLGIGSFGYEDLAKLDLPKLRHLDLGYAGYKGSSALHEVTQAAGLAKIESLVVGGVDDWMVQYLAESTFAANLRALALPRPGMMSARSIPRLRDAFPNLDRLDLRRGPEPAYARLEGLSLSIFAPVAEVVPLVLL